jgi:hypothetical protein
MLPVPMEPLMQFRPSEGVMIVANNNHENNKTPGVRSPYFRFHRHLQRIAVTLQEWYQAQVVSVLLFSATQSLYHLRLFLSRSLQPVV